MPPTCPCPTMRSPSASRSLASRCSPPPARQLAARERRSARQPGPLRQRYSKRMTCARCTDSIPAASVGVPSSTAMSRLGIAFATVHCSASLVAGRASIRCASITRSGSWRGDLGANSASGGSGERSLSRPEHPTAPGRAPPERPRDREMRGPVIVRHDTWAELLRRVFGTDAPSSVPSAKVRDACSPSSPIRPSCGRSSRTLAWPRNRPHWPGPGHRRPSARLGSTAKRATSRGAGRQPLAARDGLYLPPETGRPCRSPQPLTHHAGPVRPGPTPSRPPASSVGYRNRSLFHLSAVADVCPFGPPHAAEVRAALRRA